MSRFVYRLFGAAMLDRAVYEGIEADRAALPQAVGAVLLASVAAGVGAAGWHGPNLSTMALTAALALVTWVAWAVLMFQIGGRLMPVRETETSFSELLRTTGFAAAPGLLQAFAAFPKVTVAVFVVAWLWTFAATVVAVRQALDYGSTARTLTVCAIAAALSGAMATIIGLVFGSTVE
jgi:hypothetical protein